MGTMSTLVKRFIARCLFTDDVQVLGNFDLAGVMNSGSVPAARVDSGTLDIARSWAYTGGDVTSAAGSAVLTIGNGVVSNAKLASTAAATIKGRASGAGVGAPSDLSAAQVKTILAIAAADVSGLATIATSGSASNLTAGTVPTARLGTGTANDGTLYIGNQTHASLLDYLRYNAYYFTDFFSGASAIPEFAYTTGSGASATAATPSGGIGTLGFITDNVTAGSFGAALSAASVRFSLYRTRVTWRVLLQMLKAGSDDYAVRMGFIDTTNAKPVDGAYVEYDSSASANWRYCTANNSTRTETASGTAVTAGVWHVIAVEVSAAGTSAEFFLNGNSLGTITTNIPTGAVRLTNFGFHVVRVGGTPSQTYTATVDLVGVEFDFAAAR